ncbi:hypothetical protein ROLI_025470 [Roseobacter fucihabitans]|uniref:Uncharacterized protein n=1 Tax=Roseobacter fucihabitans TaxID=1537242 RepID=A0ABZ2BWA8_9RHOB|nr:hypothetical protein [Roseobacter litoralis]MBC6967626.1 hypothetical protein [Roseobacter litoralis]
MRVHQLTDNIKKTTTASRRRELQRRETALDPKKPIKPVKVAEPTKPKKPKPAGETT